MKKFILTTMILVSQNSFAQFADVAGCKPADYIKGGAQNVIQTPGRFFSPKCLTIKAGSSVTFQGSQTHPVRAMPDIDQFKNPLAPLGSSTAPVTVQFTTPGMFGYFCTNHGNPDGTGMAGSIIVQ